MVGRVLLWREVCAVLRESCDSSLRLELVLLVPRSVLYLRIEECMLKCGYYCMLVAVWSMGMCCIK